MALAAVAPPMTAQTAPDGSDSASGISGFIEETTTVRGDPCQYLVGGDGDRPIVLFHGGIIDAAHITSRPLLEPLAEDATVYAPNFPGYGPNPMPDEPLSIPYHVEFAAAFVDQLGIEDPLVAGISMGGGVTVGLGLEYPERVGDLVVLDAMGLGSELSGGWLTWLLAKIQVTNRLSVALMRRSRSYTRAGLEQLFAEANTVPESLVDLVQAEAQRPGAGAAFRSLRATEVTRQGYQTDYSDRLSSLSVPTDFVHGREDEVMPLDWSKRAADCVPDADLRILEDCGHLPTWERTDDVAAVVRDAL